MKYLQQHLFTTWTAEVSLGLYIDGHNKLAADDKESKYFRRLFLFEARFQLTRFKQNETNISCCSANNKSLGLLQTFTSKNWKLNSNNNELTSQRYQKFTRTKKNRLKDKEDANYCHY